MPAADVMIAGINLLSTAGLTPTAGGERQLLPVHSPRRTSTGSVRAARRAGIAVAINAIDATTTVAVASTIGSVARMP